VSFTATVADNYGNQIDDQQPTWSLAAGSDDIGTLDGSLFRAANPGTGRVQAVLGDVSALSGEITVISGILSRMELTLASQQVIGHPLVIEPKLLLRDRFDNPLADYDLAANAITLSISQGSLSPDVIDDPSVFENGIVDLRQAGVAYSGPGGDAEIQASTGGVVSNAAFVSFNGYEILGIENASGEPLNSITAEAGATARVIVQNRGSLSPVALPTLGYGYLVDGASGSTTLPLLSDGETDTVEISLPVHAGNSTNDTLGLELRSRFSIQGNVYNAVTEASQALEVRLAAQLALVPNSLTPGTVYPTKSYDFGFELDYSNLPGSPDSARILMRAVDPVTERVAAILFDGWSEPTTVTGEGIFHTDLPGSVPVSAIPGTYDVEVHYELAAGGALIEVQGEKVGSLNVLEQLDLEYVAGSLRPTMVAAGVGAAFAFEVQLNNSYSLSPRLFDSEFELRYNGFRVTANLLFPGDQLHPGQTTIQTGQVVIPDELIGQDLQASLEMAFDLEDAGGVIVKYTSDFNQERVTVEELPVAKIESVQPVTTNGTFVNTGQTFFIACRVGNESSSNLGPLELTMSSDGNSRFEPKKTIDLIEPGQTEEVLFEVTASETDAVSEVFRVDITSTGISVLPPDDNVALITIQRPAELSLNHELLGIEDSLVEFSGDFSITVRMENTGQAAVTAATYEMSTGGVDFGFGTSTFGTIRPGETAVINFQAPAFDTATTLLFTIAEQPLELNTEREVSVDGEPFEVRIRVVSAEGDLFVDPYLTGPNVLLPGRQEELFKVDVENRGASTFATVGLQEFTMHLFDTDRMPMDVADVLIAGQTGFYVNNQLVTDLTVEGNRMRFDFTTPALAAGEQILLSFRSQVRDGDQGSFLLVGNINDIKAGFTEGPNAGLSPEIVTSEDDLFLIEQVYVIKGSTLDESFVLEANPVDPAGAPARFTYELDQSGTVEFRVFTLTGEEVFAKDYPEGTPGTETGEHELFWDGRNNDGRLVRNGVYVATITNTRTNEQARIKIAIVK
jgi:hypothetical protein